MVGVAQWHCELIGNLECHGARLGKSKVVRLGRSASAHKTRLLCNECQMPAVTPPLFFGNEQTAFAGYFIGLVVDRSQMRGVVDEGPQPNLAGINNLLDGFVTADIKAPAQLCQARKICRPEGEHGFDRRKLADRGEGRPDEGFRIVEVLNIPVGEPQLQVDV